MKIKCHSGERGIALIIVMIVITILAILAGHFAASMQVETMLARNAAVEPDSEWLARGAFEEFRSLLAENNEPITHLGQAWAGGPITNGCFEGYDLHHFPVGTGGDFVDFTEREDQERYFNINIADETILRQALILIGVDAAQHGAIMDSILDWRDPDESARMNGAETSDYQNAWLPHTSKNGPLDDISELLLIHGITEQPQIFSKYFAKQGASMISRHSRLGASKFEEVAYQTTMTDLFTAVSGRLVNLNTASAEVLQLVPEIDKNLADAAVSGPAGRSGTDGPFKSVQDFAARMALRPEALPLLTRYFNVQSLVFKVTVKTDRGGTYHALFRRNSPRDIQMLYMDSD